VAITAQGVTTDRPSSFETDMMRLAGYDMAREAADQVYQAAGSRRRDIKVVELHDCFTVTNCSLYEAPAADPEGTAEKFILDATTPTADGWSPNPSGGLLSKGTPSAHRPCPVHRAGLALRGVAGPRQVDGVNVACSTTWPRRLPRS